MIYYHFTRAFLNQNKNNEKVIEVLTNFFEENKLKENIKGIGKVSSFTKSIYVLRSKKTYFEAIIEEKQIEVKDEDKVTVYFIRALKNVKNSLQDYVDIRDGKWSEKNPLDVEEEELFISQFIKDTDTSITLDVIPSEIVSWQNNYKLKVSYDIFEHYNWVNYSVNNSSKDGLRIEDFKVFLNIYRKIHKKDFGEIIHENENCKFIKHFDEEFDLILFYIEIFINNKLIKIIFGGANKAHQIEYLKKIEKEFSTLFQYTFNTLQEVSQFSLKAYPSWVLKDEELWLKIQKNNEFGNLSLLPEQTDFLENFTFPKYINGQAGSGKSTILYYLFSNIYYYKCADEIKGDIIFLTENEKLLSHTVNSIYDLIINNPEFQLSQEDADLINLNRNFNSFKEFLKSFLPKKENFNDDYYLDFSKFKVLYDDSAINVKIKKKFSAELVWFLVTTYVYGYDSDKIMTSDNYQDLMPREGKEIISHDDFRIIENEIINPFYNKLLNESGFWNKITLINYLKKNNLVNRSYEVIFCDEAQDFSKVELEFIISISMYKQYNLDNVKQFPIVFAGDALQTVNPTGFKSEVLTSMIYKSLTDPIIGFKLNQNDLIFTPQFNYRSSPSIVKLANAIQNWRKHQLGETIFDFQKSKRNDNYVNQNLIVFINNTEFENMIEVQDKIEYKTIIVPVNNNEIEEFKEEFPILKRYKNIITPIDAKGLDFSEVAIFGFGDYALKNKFGLYENKFFFNKLYVSVTRSRDELIIIDSENSKLNFWNQILSKYLEDNNADIKSIDDLIISESNSILQSKEYIVEEDALKQKELGEINKNIPILKIASNHFLKISNYAQYYFCLGIIEDINENYMKASEYYLNKELINNEEAKIRSIISLWNGKYYKDILNIKSFNNNTKRTFDKLCIVITDQQSFFDDDDIDLLEESIPSLLSIIKYTNDKSKLLNLFLNNILNSNSDTLVIRVFELTMTLFKEDLSEDKIEEIAEVLFKKKQYNSVINLYKSIKVENIYFYLSKAEISKKRSKHEDYILNLGKIIYGDFAHNKGFSIDKKEIANDILNYYLENDLNNEFEPIDYYFYAFIVISKLYILNNNDREDFWEYTIFRDKLLNDNKEAELLVFLEYLLIEEKFTHKIYNKVIVDWIEIYIELYSIEELNNEYKILCKHKKIDYTPINSIAEIKNEHHVSSIYVSKFKQFTDFKIENIGLINLIVGDNNIGKTSALEMLLIDGNKNKYFKNLLYSYIERAKVIPERIEISDKVDYQYRVENNFLNDFITKNSNENPSFIVKNGIYINQLDIKIMDIESKPFYQNFNFSRPQRISTMELDETLQVPFYTFSKGYGKELSSYYDKYVIKNREIEINFLDNLRLFIPDIERVLINSEGGIDIRLTTHDLPLHAFGDGANKLFRILLLMTIHKGKKILIDEIDSGIHFSRFKKFWEIIINVSIKDNTQVIATTHNLECIKFFESALNNEAKLKSRVIQFLKTNRLKSITYNYNNFSSALEDNFELRG